MSKKIALIGSAPSSIDLAPYTDRSWEIWGCSPGAAPKVPRANKWFELHHISPREVWYHNDYIARLNSYGCPVYVISPVNVLPNSVAYPKDDMLREFGPYFFTSSLSWMFAMAILEEPEEIALYGVDMSHQSEWEFQRSGCHYFIETAKKRGIRVTLPLESDLQRPPALYGFQEANHLYRKFRSRREELEAKVRETEQMVSVKTQELMYYKGALEDVEYAIRTWVHDPVQDELAAWQPESETQPPEPVMTEAPAKEPKAPKKRRGKASTDLGGGAKKINGHAKEAPQAGA